MMDVIVNQYVKGAISIDNCAQKFEDMFEWMARNFNQCRHSEVCSLIHSIKMRNLIDVCLVGLLFDGFENFGHSRQTRT
jgi:uncharacterized protein YdeI (YjbR/CyaY-like superfamily)